MDLGFKGKTALVTGAGSQIGFGKEIALLLAKEGCDAVAVTDINLEDVKKTEAEVKKLGGKSIALQADITKKFEVDAMVKKVVDECGKIDILCNVAGAILHKDYVPLDEQKDETWTKQMDLNLFGTMYVTRAVLPHMRKQKSGAIVNIGSGSTRQYAFGVGVYAISKYAIDLFTKQLAYQEGKNGIRCNCIAPGPAPTNFGAVLREGMPPPPPEQYNKMREEMLKAFPLGRMGTPADIANITVIMASETTNYITGQVIQVSGGNVM
ncbi:MAG: SDR family oxidoreductase [Dehalococcoidales bacterium]|nr:SDR family oxidoreductase [Dehalococcoidales bacterium]